MQRLECLQLPIEGQYLPIILMDNDDEYIIDSAGALVYDSRDNCYFFLSNDADFNGTEIEDIPQDEIPFRYSWRINNNRVIESWSQFVERFKNSCGLNGVNVGRIVYRYISAHEDDERLERFPGINRMRITIEAESCASSNFICNHYTEDRIYSGQGYYHSHHGQSFNQPIKPHKGYRMGIELEVEFNSWDERDDFTDCESNWFYLERDGSLSETGCEIITIPLLPSDAKSVDLWKTLTDCIDMHAKSWDSPRCGLHVHIGLEILGKSSEQVNENLSKMLVFYYHHLCETRLDDAVFGRHRIYNQTDGKTPIGSAAKQLGSEVFRIKEIREKVSEEQMIHNSRTRYYAINTQNGATIEFRKGRGSLKPERIAMIVEYCERICLYAKSTPWTQMSYDDFVKYLENTAKSETLISTIAHNK